MAEEGKKRYCDEVAEVVIQKMRDGTAPWVRPWAPGARPVKPANALTGREYRGLNSIWLTMRQPDDDPRWCTLKQANKLGGRVTKGSRSETIRFWTYADRRPATDDNGNQVLDAAGKPRYEAVRLERPKAFHARVFHASQIEGLPERERATPTPPAWEPCEEAERILGASGARIEHDQNDKAFYRHATDSIHLPDRSQFASEETYYSTALHELGHWTGHETRLDRDLGRHAFGSEEYAREELRAEIASYMVGTEIGVGHDAGMTAAYVESWIAALEKDPGEIYRAARDADNIMDHIMGLAREQQIVTEQTTERTYLNVERRDNKAVKALGAKWDRKERSWYAPPGVDLEPLSNWIEGQARPRPNERWVGGRHQYRDKDGGWHVGWGPDDGAQGTSVVNEDGVHVYPTGAEATAAVARLGREAAREKGGDPLETQLSARAERTYLNVEDRADNADVKALGGKWDRKERSWYAPPGRDLEPFARWLRAPTRAREQAAESELAGKGAWLTVPFAEKDEAKALGAKWNRSAGKWYAPPGTELEPLRKWLPSREAARAEAPEAAFGRFLQEAGLAVEGLPVMDGEPHRVPIADGKPGATDGMYVGHLDGKPAGYVKNWKTGHEAKWSGDAREMGREEAAQARAEAERNRQERAAQRLKEQERTADRMFDLVERELEPAAPNHPYLASKGLGETGKSFGALERDGNLFVPLRDIEGKVWSAHLVGPTGFKSFAKGGRVSGCFHVIGELDGGVEGDEAVLITSGFGTGAVIHEATGRPVVCAMSDWNMQAVAEAFRKDYPDRDIVILGDDDRHLEEKGKPNSGREKAEAAALAVGGVAVLPKFDELLPPEDHTDFADLAAGEAAVNGAAAGLNVVRLQVVFGMRAALEERHRSTEDRERELAGREGGRKAREAPAIAGVE